MQLVKDKSASHNLTCNVCLSDRYAESWSGSEV